MPWGNELIGARAMRISKNGGTGLKDNTMQTPERPAGSGGMPASSTPPGRWQTNLTAPPENPPDLTKLQQPQTAEAQAAQPQQMQLQQMQQLPQMQGGQAIQQGLLPLMHQPVTSLGISTAQNTSFGRGSQAHAQ